MLNLMPVMAISPLTIGLLVTLGVVVIVLVVLYILGNRMQKKQENAEKQMEAGAQHASLLVIDKKRMKLRDAGFPPIVLEQTPKYLRRSKVPVVKAKIGPQIMSLMCDEEAFAIIPVKKEVKVVMNGIYIMKVLSARGGLLEKPQKVGVFKRMQRKLTGKMKELKAEEADLRAKDQKYKKQKNKKK